MIDLFLVLLIVLNQVYILKSFKDINVTLENIVELTEHLKNK